MALQTCPKCGKAFYGTGCPDCDYPATPVDSTLPLRRRNFGFVSMGVSAVVFFEFFTKPLPQSKRLALLVVAFLFLLAGIQMVFAFKGRMGNLLGGLILSGFSALGFAATFSHGEISGGIPFLPYAWNEMLGKGLFCIGAVLTAVFALGCFYKILKPDKNRSK